MGGKEERISSVGRARAEAERSEEKGEVRFDIAPGPDSSELLQGSRRSPTGKKSRPTRKQVSPEPRGGPVGPEPEDVQEVSGRKARRRNVGRRSEEQLPFEHDELQ
jgi:hypothetical protein